MTVKEKILKIMSLALTISDPTEPMCGKEKTAVFIEWSPHCNCFVIRIYENGWSIHKEPSFTKMIAVDTAKGWGELTDIIILLKNIIMEMRTREMKII